jgi:transketolase
MKPSKSDLEVEQILLKCKKRLLQMHYHAGSGHIGGNFSCIDSLVVLHHCIMNNADRFILSKGHSAAALYVALWSLGLLTDEDLASFTRDNTSLASHPSCLAIPGLLFPTGSLGHGPSLAAGIALALKHTDCNNKVYCLCSDGEWQEGSCWEALIFSIHHKLDNLVILIDQNGFQGFGTTQEVISCSDLSPRIASFGAFVQTVDGHSISQLKSSLQNTNQSEMPRVVIMNTKKANGLHFEGLLHSHYLPMTADEFNFNVTRMADQ